MTGKTRWPGDLWGVDEKGELIIIEGKYRRTSDPFLDFVGYLNNDHAELLSKTIRARWQKRYDSEIKFGDNGYDRREEGETLGILPRSNKRVCPRIWKELMLGVDKEIRSNRYTDKVSSYLKIRSDRDNPPLHFWGLLVYGKYGPPKLSVKGKESMSDLANKVGQDHVHLTIASATKKDATSAKIEFKEFLSANA